MHLTIRHILGAVLLGGILSLLWLSLPPRGHQPPLSVERLPVNSLLAAAESFADPPAQWTYRFPADHGTHPEQFGEYWAVVGRLHYGQQMSLGFQLTFYRLALNPESVHSPSQWATQQVYRAVLVLDSSEFKHSEERYSRDALGLSGADANTVWLDDWSLTLAADTRQFDILARLDHQRLQLRLHTPTAEPVAITGVPGLAVAAPGSHGYWWPGWEVQGQWQMGDTEYAVTGEALLEHVWGRRLPVAQGQLTLNRLWLVGEDGTALRCLQLRRRGGGGRPLGECLLWSAEYGVQPWQPPADTLTAINPVGYPLTWVLRRGADGIPMTLTAQPRPPEAWTLPAWSGLLLGYGDAQGQTVSAWGWLDASGY